MVTFREYLSKDVYIDQLIRLPRASSAYFKFLNQGRLLSNTLIWQGFHCSRLKAPFCSQMLPGVFLPNCQAGLQLCIFCLKFSVWMYSFQKSNRNQKKAVCKLFKNLKISEGNFVVSVTLINKGNTPRVTEWIKLASTRNI